MKKTYIIGLSLLMAIVFIGVQPLIVDAQSVTIDSVSPTSVKPGSTVTLYGSGFNSGSYVDIVDLNMTLSKTSYTSSKLTFVVPSTFGVGTYNLRIMEKAGDAVSNTKTFIVDPPPENVITIDSISPTSVKPGSTVTIYGSGFDNASYVAFGEQNMTLPSSSYTSSKLTFVVPSTFGPGTYYLHVIEKAGNAESNTKSFTIDPPPQNVITLSSLNPSSAKAGSTVTIYGSGFDSASYVFFDGQDFTLQKTSYTGSSLSFVLPSWMSPGSYSLRVGEKAGDAISNAKMLTVVYEAPSENAITIDSVNPTSVKLGSTVTLYGSGFNSASYISFEGQGLTVKHSSYTPTKLTFVVPSSLGLGTRSFRVIEKAGTAESNTKTITVVQDDVSAPSVKPEEKKEVNVPVDTDVKESTITKTEALETVVTTFNLSSDADVQIEEKDSGGEVYEVAGSREVRILGIFKKKMTVVARVDAQTGAVESVKSPWWRIFVFR